MFIKKMPIQTARATGKFEPLNPLNFPRKQLPKLDEAEADGKAETAGAVEQQEHATACIPQEPLPNLSAIYALAKI